MLSLGSPGRSGSALFVAHSRTLLVKTLPHDELKHFCQVFEDYAQYIVSNAASLLPVFLGLFRFRSGTVTMYVMVTPTGARCARGCQRQHTSLSAYWCTGILRT
jgi:hypothetical protein